MVETEKKERKFLLPQDIDVKSHINTNPKASGFYSDINQQQYDALQKFKEQIQKENLVDDWVVYNDLFLLRLMRARKFDVAKVYEMFTNFLKWRKEAKVDEIEDFDFSEQLKVKEIYPHGYHKTDKYGRPIYIELISQVNIDDVLTRSNEERMIKYYIKEYERTLRVRLDCCVIKAGKIIEQSCTLICAKGLGITALTGKVKRFMGLASNIGQNYYPEMLGNMYVLNTGFFFSAVWAIAKAFIDEKTVKKIQLLGSDYINELKKHIDLENLPKILGGTCECSSFQGGCLYSDIGPWNPQGGLNLRFSQDLFWKVE